VVETRLLLCAGAEGAQQEPPAVGRAGQVRRPAPAGEVRPLPLQDDRAARRRERRDADDERELPPLALRAGERRHGAARAHVCRRAREQLRGAARPRAPAESRTRR